MIIKGLLLIYRGIIKKDFSAQGVQRDELNDLNTIILSPSNKE
jgi:hypothetical protein